MANWYSLTFLKFKGVNKNTLKKSLPEGIKPQSLADGRIQSTVHHCYKTDSWQKNTLLERMGHENQTDCILKKVFAFLFRVPLRYLSSSEVFLYHLLNCQIAKGPSSQMGSIKAVVCNLTHTAAKSFTKSSCPSITPNPQLIYVKLPA